MSDASTGGLRKAVAKRTRTRVAGRASAAAAEVLDTTEVEHDSTAAAFFDVDNTMMVGASIFHFAKGLASRKFFTTGDVAKMVWQQAKFRVAGAEDKDDMHRSRDKALAFVRGIHVAELTKLGEEIYDESMADKIYGGTRALAQRHQDAGQRVWLVTATPVELASTIAHRLGLTGALGTVAEHIDGVYTGRLVGEMMHGPAKAEAVKALADREGLDLTRCTAYSDSINDLPMLTLVGTAVAVNPDTDLREAAKQNGWEIRDFRTGRKAARIGIPTTLAAGAVTGVVFSTLAVRRRSRHRAELARASMWAVPRTVRAARTVRRQGAAVVASSLTVAETGLRRVAHALQ